MAEGDQREGYVKRAVSSVEGEKSYREELPVSGKGLVKGRLKGTIDRRAGSCGRP